MESNIRFSLQNQRIICLLFKHEMYIVNHLLVFNSVYKITL